MTSLIGKKRLLVFWCCALLAGCFADDTCVPDSGEGFAVGDYLIYCISPVDMEEPTLPDTSVYTPEDALALIPTTSPGEAHIISATKVPPLDVILNSENREFLEESQGTDDPVVLIVVNGDWTLETLRQHIDDDAYLRAEGSTYTITVPLFISGEASLAVVGPEVTSLRLAADNSGCISNHGDLFVVNSEIAGWNTSLDTPAFFENKETFRPYVSTWTGSKTYIVGSTVTQLGYDNSKSYGLSFSTTSEAALEDIATAEDPYTFSVDIDQWPMGWVSHNTISDNYMAFYSYEAMDVALVANTVTDNILYGFDPHDRSTRLLMADNYISGTLERHGLIISREVNNSYIINNHLEFNGRAGIMLDRSCTDNVVAYNTAQFNGTDGIALYESQNNLIYNNQLNDNTEIGLRLRNSWLVDIYQNTIDNHPKYGVYGYTLNLEEDDDSYERDFDVDPFSMRVGGYIDSNTFADNVQGHIRVDDLEQLGISRVITEEAIGQLFNGDLKDYADFTWAAMNEGNGLVFEPI